MKSVTAALSSGLAAHCCFIPDDQQEAAIKATSENEARALGCQENATWVLYTGPAPDDYTHSCNQHVAALLGDDPLLDIDPVSW